MEIEKFYELATKDKSGDFYSPNPLQQGVWEAYEKSDGHPALLVRAGTGAGKTEAVLFPALADEQVRRRIVMILPSKALIEDMGERVRTIGQRLSRNGVADLNITTDMGGGCRRYCCRNGEVEANTHYRHLFADDIIITTLDKFLFRVFGYGEKIKSFIFPHRIFGSAVEKKPFVIFDEAHEYDGLAFSNFIRLTEALFIRGKDLCVMSATLPETFVDFLEPVDAGAGPLGEQQAAFQNRDIVSREKKLTLISSNGQPEAVSEPPESQQPLFPETDSVPSGSQQPLFQETKSEPSPKVSDKKRSDAENLVSLIAAEVKKRYDSSKRIIARTEFVSDLLKLHDALKDLNPLIYHGRMTSAQRSKVIQELIRRQAAEEGFLVLATSAIEAGCDLDAHTIVTELCNPDSLVQLAGRLNRRGKMKDAELVVIGNTIKPFVSVLNSDQIEGYIRDLEGMNGSFQPEKLQHYFNPPSGDRMGEILFDMLWDYVYEGDLTSKPLWDRGIMVTRSWEPAVTLCTGINKKTQRPENPIQVGVSRLAKKIVKPEKEEAEYAAWLKKQQVHKYLSVESNGETNGEWHAEVKRAFFNPGNRDESRWSVYPLPEKFAVSCYETNLICEIGKEFVPLYFDEILGYKKLPKVFLKGYKDGFRQYLDYQPRTGKGGVFKIPSGKKYAEYSGRVWYLDRMGK